MQGLQKRMTALPRLLDVRDVAEILGTSVWTVRNLYWSGELPYVRVGRLLRFDVSDLEEWIRENKRTHGKPD